LRFWKGLLSVIFTFLFLLVLSSGSLAGRTCFVYLTWPSLGKDLVEREVITNGLTAEAEAERRGITFLWIKNLKELRSTSQYCSTAYLFLAGHSDEDLIGSFPPSELRQTLVYLRKKGVKIPLLVFDTCYWGKVYKLRYFSFPDTVVVGSPVEELQYGLKPLYSNLSYLSKKGIALVKELANRINRLYIFFYDTRGKQLADYGFRCQAVRIYYEGVVYSYSACWDGNRRER